jgi:hypothetical protein
VDEGFFNNLSGQQVGTALVLNITSQSPFSRIDPRRAPAFGSGDLLL